MGSKWAGLKWHNGNDASSPMDESFLERPQIGPHLSANPLLHQNLRGKHGKEGLHGEAGFSPVFGSVRGDRQVFSSQRWLDIVSQLEKDTLVT
jgi:hypothetical protein